MRLILQCTTLVLQILSVAGVGLRVDTPHRRLDEDPETNPTTSVITLSKEKYNFGEAITVDFTNGSPASRANSYPYLAIFSDQYANATLDQVPSFDYFLAWLNDCNSQNDCESVVTEGSVEFSAADPREAYYYTYDYYGYEYEYGYGYFPFRDGKYVVCFLNDVYDVDATDDGSEAIDQTLITDCKRFQVRKPKKKMKKKAKVIAKRKIKFGDDFTATIKTPVPIPNQWVGVYKAEKGKAPKGPLDDKALLWGYTACETQEGDQAETTNCNAKSKNSKISLGENFLNIDNVKAVWPLKKGKYFMCVNFHSNVPYNQFKCSKNIKVQ